MAFLPYELSCLRIHNIGQVCFQNIPGVLWCVSLEHRSAKIFRPVSAHTRNSLNEDIVINREQ